MQAKSDAELQAHDARAETPPRQRRVARRDPARGVRRLSRGGAARAGHAPLRRAADGRHGAAPGRHRRDEDRRGQDAGRHAAGLPERAGRQGRSRHHRQRLPRAPRLGVDGAHLQVPRPVGRHRRARAHRRRAAAQLPRRHRVRHQLGVRLRLPARQHEGLDRALRAARSELRDRRRGRLDPDRRGAHAAHHLGPGRAVGRSVPEGQRDHPGAAQGHRLHRRREGALGDHDRQRDRARRAATQRRQPLQPREHRVVAPRDAGACARTRCTSAT